MHFKVLMLCSTLRSTPPLKPCLGDCKLAAGVRCVLWNLCIDWVVYRWWIHIFHWLYIGGWASELSKVIKLFWTWLCQDLHLLTFVVEGAEQCSVCTSKSINQAKPYITLSDIWKSVDTNIHLFSPIVWNKTNKQTKKTWQDGMMYY